MLSDLISNLSQMLSGQSNIFICMTTTFSRKFSQFYVKVNGEEKLAL